MSSSSLYVFIIDCVCSYIIRFSAMTMFSAVSLPPESSLLPIIEHDDEIEDNNRNEEHTLHTSPCLRNPSSNSIYAIRDDSNALVCSLSLRDGSESSVDSKDILKPRPGKSLIIILDFRHLLDEVRGEQGQQHRHCQAVTAKFMQKELRPDGSRIQVK